MKAKKLGRKTSLQGIFYYTFSRWRCCALETSTGLIICFLAWRAWYDGEANVIRAFYCAPNISFRATVCLHLFLLCSICLNHLEFKQIKLTGNECLCESVYCSSFCRLSNYSNDSISSLLEEWRRIVQFKIPNAIRLGNVVIIFAFRWQTEIFSLTQHHSPNACLPSLMALTFRFESWNQILSINRAIRSVPRARLMLFMFVIDLTA